MYLTLTLRGLVFFRLALVAPHHDKAGPIKHCEKVSPHPLRAGTHEKAAIRTVLTVLRSTTYFVVLVTSVNTGYHCT